MIGRVRPEIHVLIGPIIERVAQAEPRLIRYLDRLNNALVTLEAGDAPHVRASAEEQLPHGMVRASWEELIRLSGRKRTE